MIFIVEGLYRSIDIKLQGNPKAADSKIEKMLILFGWWLLLAGTTAQHPSYMMAERIYTSQTLSANALTHSTVFLCSKNSIYIGCLVILTMSDCV